MNGREVENYILGFQYKGLHEFHWQPNNIGSGVYFISLESNIKVNTNKSRLFKMIKYIIPLIFVAKGMVFADTTIIALEQLHQFLVIQEICGAILIQLIFLKIICHILKFLYECISDCPAGGCDPWDRKANIQIKQFDEWFEIGRYVTPYGIGCSWVFDVTDYRSI